MSTPPGAQGTQLRPDANVPAGLFAYERERAAEGRTGEGLHVGRRAALVRRRTREFGVVRRRFDPLDPSPLHLSPMEPLAGRVGIVTGASAGIGVAAARALAAAGMTVVLAARRAERLDALAHEIRAAGGTADAVATDLRDERQVEALVDGAVARHGRLDALVNNAAVGTIRPIADGRTAEWRAILETNVLGVLVACRAALRHMLPAGRGDIVNVTSASAHEAWPYLAVYAASKAAVHTLSRGLRAEVAERGVRVMTLEVHNVRGTEFAGSFDPALLPDALAAWRARGLLNPAAPMIEPADVAAAVVFQLAARDPASVHEVVLRSRSN